MGVAIGETTWDALLRGRIELAQPARGFRSSLDPVLLAGFVEPPFGRILDVGCGSGALAFLLLAADPAATAVGVEIQPRLAALAGMGRDRNGFQARMEIVAGDVRALGQPLGRARFDLVAANPPFRPVARGAASPDGERAAANHEVSLSLPDWLDACARAVAPEGRVAAIYAAERGAELLAGMVERGLHPVRFRSVHPRAGRPARRILVEARRGRLRPLAVLPPLVVHEERGYTPEVLRLLGDGGGAARR